MSSSAFPIICAIFALFCCSLVSISASKNSTAPIYVRYVRRRPPWFPGDLYVEEVVEEFRTKSKPPMFGSSEIEIQQFLENDQKLQEAEAEAALGAEVKTNSATPAKGEKRKIGTLRQVKKPPIIELKPTITVTVYKPSDSLAMRVNEFVKSPEPCTTTMKVPYTNVITNSVEIDYYDIDEGWSHIPISASTTKTTTQRPVWKLFRTSTISPKTTKTVKTSWTPIEPSNSRVTTPTSKTTTRTPGSFWVNFGQTKSTSTTTTEKPIESTVSTATTTQRTYGIFNYGQTKSTSTTTTEKPIESTVPTATTTQRTYGIFNLFGKSAIPSTTTETPTTTTEFFEEPTTTEFVSTFPDSAEEDKTTTTEIGTVDSLGESIEILTSIPTTEGSSESVIKNFDDDYVNGEVVDSIEEGHTATSLNTEPTITEESEEVTTTTKKTKLFGWFG